MFLFTGSKNGSSPTRVNVPPRGRRAEVDFEMIACPADGKTVLKWSLNQAMNNRWLPSGIQIDVANPQAVAEMLRRERMTRIVMEKDVLPRTTTTEAEEYEVSIGERKMLAIRTREVIGQVLTHTRPDSPKEMQDRYHEYIERLGRTDCLWVLVPIIPAESTGRDRERFKVKLRLCSSYLKEALKTRAVGQPVTVALVLSKLDSAFDSPEAAQATLSDDLLRQELMPLVNLVAQSTKVGASAVFPISSFGFNNAVPYRCQVVDQELDIEAACEEDLHWTLRSDAEIEPYNVAGLMIWSIIHSLAPREVNENQPGDQALIALIRRLSEDLKALAPWIVPIKGLSVPVH